MLWETIAFSGRPINLIPFFIITKLYTHSSPWLIDLRITNTPQTRVPRLHMIFYEKASEMKRLKYYLGKRSLHAHCGDDTTSVLDNPATRMKINEHNPTSV